MHKGFLAEVQILVAGIYTLKGEQTPLYNLARSLGLVGPLQPQHAVLVESAAVTDRVRPPLATRVLLVALRMMVSLNTTMVAPFYLFLLVTFDSFVMKPKVEDEVVEEPTYDPQVRAPVPTSPSPSRSPSRSPSPSPHPIPPQIVTPLSLWGIESPSLPVRLVFSLALIAP